MKKHLPAFLLGFTALSFQVILIREYSIQFLGNEIAIGILLAFWLFWTGIGSLSAPLFSYNRSRLYQWHLAAIFLFPLCLSLLRLSRFLFGGLPGEPAGLIPAAATALILTFLTGFPFGLLFFFNARYLKNRWARVYWIECLGSAAAGFFTYFILVPLFSNWQAAALTSGLVLVLLSVSPVPKSFPWLRLILALYLAGFWILDRPLQKYIWLPYQLEISKDSKFGKWQILRDRESLSFYFNGNRTLTYPETSNHEEAVHFACPLAEKQDHILLLGGVSPGILQELLKYPISLADAVEPDQKIISLYREFLPKEALGALEDNRIRLHPIDTTAFLRSCSRSYDVILINHPDPTSAQSNRFFTFEFFQTVAKHLEKGGILSFRVSSSENYLSPHLLEYLASFHSTLKQVFPYVAALPGEKAVFLASFLPIPLEQQELVRRLDELNIGTRYITSYLLFTYLDPFRIQQFQHQLESSRAIINRDYTPISYYFNSRLRSLRFQGIETGLLDFFLSAGKTVVFAAPLACYCLILILSSLRNPTAAYSLAPLFMMGLSSILIEIIVFIIFQIQHGFLYHALALLFMGFMAGLSGGALSEEKRRVFRSKDLLALLTGLIISLLILKILAARYFPFSGFILYLALLGFLGGRIFVVSNRLFLQQKTHLGIGYAVELLGSFFGALITSTVLIPLFGLQMMVDCLLAANGLTLVFLMLISKRVKFNLEAVEMG